MKCKIIDGSSWADLEKKVDAWLKKEKPSKVHLSETHNGKSIWLHRVFPSTVIGQLQPREAVK